MKTRALLLTVPLLAVAACTTHPRASVEAQAICAMTDDCKFQSTCTNVLMGNPGIDTTVTNVLWVPLMVANQLPNNEDVKTGKLNTNDAHIDGYVLEYGGGGFGTLTFPVNQYVPASGTAVIALELIPGLSASALQSYSGASGRILPVNVRLRGYLDDGTRFETGDFPVSVQTCQGCQTACPTGTVLKCPLYPAGVGQSPRSCL